MALVYALPKLIPPLIEDFGPKLREKQLLAARKLQVAEASSIMTSDSCETAYGVCAASVEICMYSLLLPFSLVIYS